MRLSKSETRGRAVVLTADNGRRFLIQAVNRDYGSNGKVPRYFLSELFDRTTRYWSGLFPIPGAARVYSLDHRDELGIKSLWRIAFTVDGSVAILEPGDARRWRPDLAALEREPAGATR